MDSYRRICIYCKKNHGPAKSLGLDIAAWLNTQGCQAALLADTDCRTACLKHCDFMLALGGDGTILEMARLLAGSSVPVFGINFGRIGFLTAANPENWRDKLSAALNGKMNLRHCLALKWEARRGGNILGAGLAANDVVISRYFPARLCLIEIKTEALNLGVLRSDGLIATTPLGSTGYSVSAGGSILYAALNVIGLTPICPFATGLRPMVLPPEIRLELRIVPRSAESYVTFDGQESLKLEENDTITLSGMPDAIQIFGTSQQLLEHLQKRGIALDKC